MDLKEAIRYNEAIRKGIDKDEMPKHREAVRLGIEALKLVQRQSPNRALPGTELLPGETLAPLILRGARGVMSEKNDQDRGFLKGIRLSAFLDCYQEWHAFVEGLFEVLCPWPARYKLSGQLLDDLKKDHHYYAFGRVMGVIAWLIIAKIIQEAFF